MEKLDNDTAVAVAELQTRIESGEARALARAISLVESGTAEGQALLARLRERGGRARIVGVTGAPGSGKSTLTDGLVAGARERGERVAVVAVDPSSPFTGGAILGDRIRMTRWHSDPQVFIRSMAARGHLGGLAAATLQVVALLDAVGFDTVLLETVGVGQSEVEIADAADTTLLVLTPGQGDSVQAFKAGIMEIADVFVINKADQPGAARLRRELRAMLQIAGQSPRHSGGSGERKGAGVASPSQAQEGGGAGDRAEGEGSGAGDGWRIPIVETVASEGTGLDEVMDQTRRHGDFLRTVGMLEELRRRRARFEISAILQEELRLALAGREDSFVDSVLTGRLTPAEAVAQLLGR